MPAYTLPSMGGPGAFGPGKHPGGRGWVGLGAPVKTRIHLSVHPSQLVPSIHLAEWGSWCFCAAHAPSCPCCLAAKDSFNYPISASVSPSLRGPSLGRGENQGIMRGGKIQPDLPLCHSGQRVQAWPGTPPSSSLPPTGITLEPGTAWWVSGVPREGSSIEAILTQSLSQPGTDGYLDSRKGQGTPYTHRPRPDPLSHQCRRGPGQGVHGRTGPETYPETNQGVGLAAAGSLLGA